MSGKTWEVIMKRHTVTKIINRSEEEISKVFTDRSKTSKGPSIKKIIRNPCYKSKTEPHRSKDDTWTAARKRT